MKSKILVQTFLCKTPIQLETLISQDWKKNFLTAKLKMFWFHISKIERPIPFLGSDIFVLLNESWESGSYHICKKEYLCLSMIGEVLLHIGKNPSKVRHWLTSVICFILQTACDSRAGSTVTGKCWIFTLI